MQMQTPPQVKEMSSTLLVDKREAAARLSVSLRTLDELCAKKALRHVKIGRSVRFRPAALEAFIEANER